jgi:predicted phosphodiesterase
MRLGILADIHEDARHLQRALEQFRQEGVDQIVLLGDVVDMGRRLEQVVALLAEANVVGVWGNHELGLCHEPDERTRALFAGPVLDFMQALRPHLEVEDCLFTHGLPFWDTTDPAIYYLGGWPDDPENLARGFQASGHRVFFLGHFHRWLLATPQGCRAWGGEASVPLDAATRWLVVVAAVCDGWCAVYDTAAGRLTPRHLG